MQWLGSLGLKSAMVVLESALKPNPSTAPQPYSIRYISGHMAEIREGIYGMLHRTPTVIATRNRKSDPTWISYSRVGAFYTDFSLITPEFVIFL